jgi:hypothetical protein
VIDAAMLADFTGPDVVALAREALDGFVKAGGWSDEEADEIVEWMLRVLLSLLVAPAPDRSEAELRSLLNRRLVPVLGRTSQANGEMP